MRMQWLDLCGVNSGDSALEVLWTMITVSLITDHWIHMPLSWSLTWHLPNTIHLRGSGANSPNNQTEDRKSEAPDERTTQEIKLKSPNANRFRKICRILLINFHNHVIHLCQCELCIYLVSMESPVVSRSNHDDGDGDDDDQGESKAFGNNLSTHAPKRVPAIFSHIPLSKTRRASHHQARLRITRTSWEKIAKDVRPPYWWWWRKDR